MSILNKTPIIGLTQFTGNILNFANIYSRYNSDMLKIDEYVGGLGEDIDARLTAMESDISEFESSVNETVATMTEAFNDLSTEVGTYDNRLTALEEANITINETLNAHAERLTTLEDTVASLDPQYVADLRARLTAVEQKVDTNATAIASLNEDVNRVEADIVVINGKLVTIDGRLDSAETRLTNLENCCNEVNATLINLQSQITSNDEDIAGLQTRMSEAENNIAGNAQDIITVTTQTAVNTADIAELKTRVGDLEDAIQEVDNWENRIEAVENTVAGYNDSIAQAVSDSATALATANAATLQVDALDNRVTTAENNVTAIDGRMTLAESDIDAAEADIDALELVVGDSNAGLVKDVADLQTQNGSSVLTTTAQTLSGAVNELDSRLDAVEDFNDNGSTSLLTKGLTINFKRKAGWVYANVTGTLTGTIANGIAWNEIVPIGYRPSFDAPSSIPNVPTDVTNSLLSLTFESDGVIRGYTAGGVTIQSGQTVNCKLIYPCA